MWVNNAESVSQALSQGLHALRVRGIKQPSRVGDVLVSPHPVLTVYKNPMNRVLFSPMRDANPFFHVMESLWMLAGRNDLPWLAQFNKRMATYSDDGGTTQPGAYGYRWRRHFGYDQLETIIVELKHNPQTRRAVLAMWDGGHAGIPGHSVAVGAPGDLADAISGSADVPCNTHAYFDTIDGKLNMTVCNRSNDIVWGAHGANAVHFSFLLEYVAAMTGIPMGVYRQFSNNYHVYTNVVSEESLMPMSRDVEATDRYFKVEHAIRKPLDMPLRYVELVDYALHGTASLEPIEALHAWLADPSVTSSAMPFLTHVARPMWYAWQAHKAKNYDEAIDLCHHIKADDWQLACKEWLQRRKQRASVNAQPFTEVTDGNA